MAERMGKRQEPFPIVVDTMPGRDLKATYIDQRMHTVSDSFHRGHPYPLFGESEDRKLPY